MRSNDVWRAGLALAGLLVATSTASAGYNCTLSGSSVTCGTLAFFSPYRIRDAIPLPDAVAALAVYQSIAPNLATYIQDLAYHPTTFTDTVHLIGLGHKSFSVSFDEVPEAYVNPVATAESFIDYFITFVSGAVTKVDYVSAVAASISYQSLDFGSFEELEPATKTSGLIALLPTSAPGPVQVPAPVAGAALPLALAAAWTLTRRRNPRS